MSEEEKKTDTVPPTESAESVDAPKRPEDELAAAFSHLKSAADLFAKKLDPAVRRAAGEAEKALEKVANGTERAAADLQTAAKPFAAKVGGEIGKFADGLRKAVQGLEKSGDETPPKKDPPDPDDPNASSL